MTDLTTGGLSSGINFSFRTAPSPGAKALVGGSAYEAGSSTSRELAGWNTSIRSPDNEILPSRDTIVSRSRDLLRNNGWASGGIDRKADAVIGAQIRLEARPDYEAMNLTPEWSDEWSRIVEAKWRSYANDSRMLCDVERHYQFGGLVRLAYLHYLSDGDACAPIYWLDRGGRYSTAVNVIDSDRLSNRDDAPDNDFLRGGVMLDQWGAAIGYQIRVDHPQDTSLTYRPLRWETIPREGPTGRPLFVHVFNKRRGQQRRGVALLAPIIKRLKMLDRYDNAELEAALLNAVMAAIITSPYQAEDVKAALAPVDDEEIDASAYSNARMEYREKNKLFLNGTQINHLFPGEKMEFVAAERPSSQFAAFESAVLRSVAAALGLSYEQLSQDWANINYSSARTLLNEIWRGFLVDRHLFTQSFCTPIYSAWLEEAVLRGEVPVPGGPMNFYKWRAELTQAMWIGPGRGSIDPLKEAKAGETGLATFQTNLQIEAGDHGRDWREVLYQRSRETRLADKLGLNPAPVQPASAGAPPANQSDNEDDDQADDQPDDDESDDGQDTDQ